MVTLHRFISSPFRSSLLGAWAYCAVALFFWLGLPEKGHAEAGQFLVVRMDVTPPKIRLEIVAEYGENSQLKDEKAAGEAIHKSFLVQQGGKFSQLFQLAPLKMVKRKSWDSAGPDLYPSSPDGQPPQLLAGVWEWRPPEDTLKLHVPKEPQQDVLLWTLEKNPPAKQPKWLMLIAGDTSPEITVGGAAYRWDLIIRVGFVFLVLLGWSLMKMQKRGLKRRSLRVESRRPGR